MTGLTVDPTVKVRRKQIAGENGEEKPRGEKVCVRQLEKSDLWVA